jgi:hypothetical protein
MCFASTTSLHDVGAPHQVKLAYNLHNHLLKSGLYTSKLSAHTQSDDTACAQIWIPAYVKVKWFGLQWSA